MGTFAKKNYITVQIFKPLPYLIFWGCLHSKCLISMTLMSSTSTYVDLSGRPVWPAGIMNGKATFDAVTFVAVCVKIKDRCQWCNNSKSIPILRHLNLHKNALNFIVSLRIWSFFSLKCIIWKNWLSLALLPKILSVENVKRCLNFESSQLFCFDWLFHNLRHRHLLQMTKFSIKDEKFSMTSLDNEKATKAINKLKMRN